MDSGLIDVFICRSYQFGVAQLMELAGLSCAQAVARVYPSGRAALVVAGPGNNGGDGLVLARHLVLLGFSATLFYPRRTSNPLYSALLHQAEQSGVTVRSDLPSLQVMQDWIWWIYVITTALHCATGREQAVRVGGGLPVRIQLQAPAAGLGGARVGDDGQAWPEYSSCQCGYTQVTIHTYTGH